MAGEFHRSLRGGGFRHIPMIESFTGYYMGEVLRHILMAGSLTCHYVGVSRHTPTAGSFTGHYVGVSRHIPMAGISLVTIYGFLDTN